MDAWGGRSCGPGSRCGSSRPRAAAFVINGPTRVANWRRHAKALINEYNIATYPPSSAGG